MGLLPGSKQHSSGHDVLRVCFYEKKLKRIAVVLKMY